uniref:Magnesium-dependent phosphatase-1 n=1 Tax=Prymnesium polylepis TaxID=72548 RepID=A0A7S4HGM3_9EUKA|mmetsp:Transcript_16962/g.42795  ORF Transcript_16962/g.42795 Transcript_16962/m.42795 type:complete len:221 (+) Transcript_16962:18-680(+)
MAMTFAAAAAAVAGPRASSGRVRCPRHMAAGPVMLDAALPKAVVFDLDGCLWFPDMYMLWGGGAPFTIREDGDLDDQFGKRVYLLGAVRQVLHSLKTAPEWEGVVVAVASKTDEPEWARECMQKFEVGPTGSGIVIEDCIDVEDIDGGNKQGHFKRIAERTGIELEDMIFFDNERGNCLDVAQLGVTVAWVPEGVTAGAWDESIERFPEPGSIFDFRMGG